jgi:hypothetical protein
MSDTPEVKAAEVVLVEFIEKWSRVLRGWYGPDTVTEFQEELKNLVHLLNRADLRTAKDAIKEHHQ